MTAELAVALPAVVGLAVAVVWLVALAAAQVRCVDAAREAARALARDDPMSVVTALAREVGPPGASVHVTRSAGRVEVVVRTRVAGPGVLGGLPAVEVDGRAVAAVEEAGADRASGAGGP